MTGSKAGARHRCAWSPPLLAAVLVLAFLPATAAADPPTPPRCVGLDPAEPSYCIGLGAVREADRLRAALPEVRHQLRLSDQRLAIAAGDALRLAATVDAQAAVVLDLRRALASERARLPAWSWYLTGLASGVVLAVAAIVIGALSL